MACLTVAVVLFVASLNNLSLAQHYNANIPEKSGLTGRVTVLVNGEFWCETPNVVVDIGEKRIRDSLGWANASGSTNATKYIALSPDSAPAATATKLTNEYTTANLTRATGTVTIYNGTAYQVAYTFTCSSDSQTVTSSAVHWSPDSDSDNNMYCCADLSNAPTLDTDDTCTITWTLNSESG